MRVYLSGPMEDCTKEERDGWRFEVVDRLAPLGVDVVIPPVASGEDVYLRMVEKDKSDIRASDFVIANPWKTSTGTPMEVMYAHLIGVPVIVVERPGGYVNPWMRRHSQSVASSVREACAVVIEAVLPP